jgi:L-ascorbate metabolism protein UlaG (beta-lactamase superfamily)
MSIHDSLSRRRLLTTSAAALAAGGAVGALATGAALARPAADGRWHGPPGTSGVTLRWLGNNAWEIRFGQKVILIDPWMTRFHSGTYGPGGARPDTPLVIDQATVDRYVTRADLVLVGHGHFDHITDVPYVARRTGAGALGTETHANLLTALGTPAAQLTTVRGGEFLQYDGFTVEVFASLHSLTGVETTTAKQVPFPGTRPGASVPVPRTIADLVEGGTLAYQITIDGRFRILALSTANFVERELAGLRPDLAIVAVGGRSLHDYAGRLMRALDRPTWVLPTHWDDIDFPLDQPAHDVGGLEPLRTAIAAASPHTTFTALDHLQTLTP